MSNKEDDRARLLVGGVVDSLGRTLWPVDLVNFVTTCSIPIIDSTRRPRPAMRGEGSLASVHIADTYCEYNAVSKGLDLA